MVEVGLIPDSPGVSVDPGNQIMPTSGARTELADTSATNLLAELPVLETEANGVNLGLTLADGTQLAFTSTSQLATFLYALAVQQMQATSFVTDNYNLDMQWLNTIDQPLLDQAVCWSQHAAYLQNLGGATHGEQAIEFNDAAAVALQIAGAAPSGRTDKQVTIANAANGGNPTEITVFANGSGVSVHDIAPPIGPEILSAVSTVLNVAALVTGQAYLYFAAAALDAAQSGVAFSSGQDLQGILDAAQALGNTLNGVAGTTTSVSKLISIASQAVGGVYGIVTSAESGNGAGILAGALEVAAATAGGIAMAYSGQTQTLLNQVATALGSAGVATTMASAFASGNLGAGLVDSLNLFLPALADEYLASQATISQAVNADNISPSSDMLGTPQHIAFVGGFFDDTLYALTGSSPVESAYKAYVRAYPGADVQYFTWDDASGLANWANQNGGQVTVVAHSYGADTAASVVASGVHVQTLVTLDPVSYNRPNFQQVAANAGQWLDFVATGGGLTLPNAIAGIGGAWNNATQGYATQTVAVNVDHANIAGTQMMNQLLGLYQ